MGQDLPASCIGACASYVAGTSAITGATKSTAPRSEASASAAAKAIGFIERHSIEAAPTVTR
jgi:hypothetical protein